MTLLQRVHPKSSSCPLRILQCVNKNVHNQSQTPQWLMYSEVSHSNLTLFLLGPTRTMNSKGKTGQLLKMITAYNEAAKSKIQEIL